MNIKRCSTVVLIACATGAAFSTFFGVRSMMAGGIEGIVVPIVMALGVGAGLGLLWHLMLHIVPGLSTTGLRITGLVLAVALTFVAMAISSWFVCTAIGGRNAVHLDMADRVEAARHALDTAAGNALAEQQLVPDLARLASEMAALAEAERQDGRLSGRSGRGPVVEALRAGAAAWRAALDEAAAVRDRLDGLRASASKDLKAMDQIVAASDSPTEAQRRFAGVLGDFRQKIAEVEALSILPAVRRVAMTSVSAAGLSPGQSEAIAGVNAAFARQSEQLTRKADAIAAQKRPVESVQHRPIKPGEAVIQHADRVMAAWMVGVGVDLLPLLLLSLLVVAAMEEATQAHAQRASAASDEARRPQLVAAP